MLFAGILFAGSLFGIVALFSLKRWETRRARIILPRLRASIDARAGELKELLDAARLDFAKIPPEALRLSRIGIHQLALAFAALAGRVEKHSHQVADLVSYKHRFEKRDTQSEFLKKVSEHKNGGADEERNSA